jgi:hypothetical protein
LIYLSKLEQLSCVRKDAGCSRRWLEIWVGPNADADRLLVLRSADDGACELIDPETGWSPLQRFASYDAAAGWLNGECYARGGGRCAAP